MKQALIIFFAALWNIGRAYTPEFAIITPSGGFYLYASSISDSIVSAKLSNNNNIWTLQIKANTNIKTVMFPFEANRKPLDNNIADDIYYYPHLAGLTEKASNRNTDWDWFGLTYPGEIFAPLVVIADSNNARIVAATNWPPKTVLPWYAAERVLFEYEKIYLAPNDSSAFAILIDSVTSNSSSGEKPWQLALDKYQDWLSTVMPPVNYPSALQNADGFIYVGLQNQASFDLNSVSQLWSQWRDKLPWLQLWGQMSNFAGDSALADPPLLPGEEVDCCALNQSVHSRYLPDLTQFMEDSVVALGYHGGYYSAPFYGNTLYPKLLVDTDTGKNWLVNWLDKNEFQFNANAFYIDVLGRGYYGHPDSVRTLFDGIQIRPMTIIEGMVDIYPTAGLLSGSYTAGPLGWQGGPGITPENSIAATFPQMQRYLLNDRAVFMGYVNGDNANWGPAKNYWSERQTFLLGAKYETGEPNENAILATPNQMLLLAIAERSNVSWWQRKPLYMDTKGLTNIPAGIDVRRFVDNNGCHLFAIDNYNQLSGKTFTFQSQTYAISTQKLSIVVDCNATGMGNSYSGFELSAYPNPFASSVTLQSNIALVNASLIVYNVYGQVVQRANNIWGHTTVLQRDNLSGGLYYIQMKDNDKVITTTKVVITD